VAAARDHVVAVHLELQRGFVPVCRHKEAVGADITVVVHLLLLQEPLMRLLAVHSGQLGPQLKLVQRREDSHGLHGAQGEARAGGHYGDNFVRDGGTGVVDEHILVVIIAQTLQAVI